MNEEFKSALRKILIVALTALATKLHLSDVSWIFPVATDVVDLGIVAWGLYAHRGMVKVPANAVVAVLALMVFFSPAIAPALASDLPPPRVQLPTLPLKAPPVTVAFSWSGCSLGVNGGLSWADVSYDFVTFPATGKYHPTGGLLGGSLTCDYQTGNIVVGAKVDFDWNLLHGQTDCAAGGTCRVKSTWDAIEALRVGFTGAGAGSVAGRLGQSGVTALGSNVSLDKTLFYAFGGVAERDIHPDVGGSNDKIVAVGYAVGGGVETPWTQHVTTFAEFAYENFGKKGFTCFPACGVFNANESFKDKTIRAGVRYRF